MSQSTLKRMMGVPKSTRAVDDGCPKVPLLIFYRFISAHWVSQSTVIGMMGVPKYRHSQTDDGCPKVLQSNQWVSQSIPTNRADYGCPKVPGCPKESELTVNRMMGVPKYLVSGKMMGVPKYRSRQSDDGCPKVPRPKRPDYGCPKVPTKVPPIG